MAFDPKLDFNPEPEPYRHIKAEEIQAIKNLSGDKLNHLLKHLETPWYVAADQSWRCLLKNHPQAADHFYEKAFGDLSILLHKVYDSKAENKYFAGLHINSIDDVSIVLLGPSETLDKAKIRMTLLLEQTSYWHGWIPTEEQVQAAAHSTGTYWNR
jgi:hypothetical protein